MHTMPGVIEKLKESKIIRVIGISLLVVAALMYFSLEYRPGIVSQEDITKLQNLEGYLERNNEVYSDCFHGGKDKTAVGGAMIRNDMLAFSDEHSRVGAWDVNGKFHKADDIQKMISEAIKAACSDLLVNYETKYNDYTDRYIGVVYEPTLFELIFGYEVDYKTLTEGDISTKTIFDPIDPEQIQKTPINFTVIDEETILMLMNLWYESPNDLQLPEVEEIN